MKFKTILKKYPKMEVVLDTIMVMKREGTRYKELREIWEKEAYRLYPNDYKHLRFPSRQTLWKLEKDYWFITCPMCGQKVHRTETIETFMTEPQPHWSKVCKQCYLEKKWQYYTSKGHSPRIEDYVSIRRGNSCRYTDPRADEQ